MQENWVKKMERNNREKRKKGEEKTQSSITRLVNTSFNIDVSCLWSKL